MTHLLNILTDQDRFDYLAAWLGILTCKFHCGVYCPSPCTTSTPGGTLKSNNEDRRPVLVRILKKTNSDRDPSECANRRRRIWKFEGSTSMTISWKSVFRFGYIRTTLRPSKNGFVLSNSKRVNSLRRFACPSKNIIGIRSSKDCLTASLLTCRSAGT